MSAGSKNGFITGAHLVFRAGLATGDYHGQMNAENYEKWMREKLIPNLPKECVVVMDNAPYHNKQVNKAPTKYSTKQSMVQWLRENNVPHSEEMRKYELWEIVEKFKPASPTFRGDELLKLHGHKVCRLPPYMCELNAIELAWAKVKRLVRETNITADLSLTKLREVTENAMASVTTQDWEGYDLHVQSIEKQYWEKDALLEETVDRIIINLGTSISDSEEDSDEENADDEGLSDSSDTLAVPLDA